MNQALATIENPSLKDFQTGVDCLLDKRKYFMAKILPTLKEGIDFHVIKGKKSLSKSGAETLCSIYSLVASFTKDTETMESFKGVDDLVAYKCTLTRGGEFCGEGRGASTLKQNNGDFNKTVKMAQKSAFVDGTIRSTGLSNLFTQDIEDMDVRNTSSSSSGSSLPSAVLLPNQKTVITGKTFGRTEVRQDDVPTSYEDWYEGERDTKFPYDDEEGIMEPIPSKKKDWGDDHPMTAKQRSYLTSLINEQITDPNERERFFVEMENCDRVEASELISSFTMNSRY